MVGEAPGRRPPFSDLGRTRGSPPDGRHLSPGGIVVLLPYSSGTTGLPKRGDDHPPHLGGQPLPEGCGFDATESGRALACLPFFHMYGAWLLTVVLAGGATLVTMPRFDLSVFLAAVQHHRVTRASLVPPVVLALVNEPMVDA